MIKKVTFPNKELNLAGQLFLPADFDSSKTYPSLVIAHPEGAVKEQAPATYAEKLVQYGFVCLTFDGAYMGESDGEPHFTTDPFQRVEDIRAAVDYLTTLDFIDNEKISGLGICAGGAYMIDAGKTEKRFNSVGAVVPVNMGAGTREAYPTSEAMNQVLLEAAEQRTREANGAEVKLIETVAPNDEAAKEFPPRTLFREARSYYRGVKQNPRSTGQQVFSAIDKLLRYDAYSQMSELWTLPLLAISGTDAKDTIGFAKQAVELSNGLGKLEVIDGASHVDLYYKDQYVDQAVEMLAKFFKDNL